MGRFMNKIKEILTGTGISKSQIKKQRLSTAKAWQILNIYPRRKQNSWKIYRNLRGVLLADEVGSGKTFEALAIITKDFIRTLRAGKLNFRVLIIANPAIRSKWENIDKKSDIAIFLEHAKKNYYSKKLEKLFLDLGTSSDFIIKSKKNWKGLGDLPSKCIVLSSVQALPPARGRKKEAVFQKKYKFPLNKFNWIIADEAHIVKSGYNQKDEDVESVSNTAIRKLYATLNSQNQAKILLLTATPFHNNVNELIQMISLLDHHGKTQIVNTALYGLKKLQEEFNSLNSLVANGDNFYNKLDFIYEAANNNISTLLPDKLKISRPKELKRNGQKNGLDDFLRDLIVRSKKPPLTPQNRNITLTENHKLQYLLLRDLVLTEEEDAKRMVSIQLSQLVSNPRSLQNSFETKNMKKKKLRLNIYNKIVNLFGEESLYKLKLDELLKIIDEPDEKRKSIITVFCRFIPGIDKLEKDLVKRGEKVYKLDGRTKVKDRKNVLSNLKDAQKENLKGILLVSQVGNEGLDFDEFSNTIVHFDGHYNPAVMDQRNGRVYRRKNKAEDIKVYSLILSETYDQRIKFIEEEKKKLKDFYLGDGSFDKVIDSILKRDQQEKKKKLNKLLKFKIDLEPKREHLLRPMLKEI
jgi:SNF2 family DNA or RNA helicase